jgi:hypothetical protein
MTTRALIIGKPERERIADAISNARDKTVSREQVEALSMGIPQDSAVLNARIGIGLVAATHTRW